MRKIAIIIGIAIVAAVLTVVSVRAQAVNKISSYALRSGVRGYSCAAWANLTPELRSAYLLGVIALSDALEHGSNDEQFSLTTDDYKALNLPRSANDYATMVSTGCGQVAGTTPALAVLFQVK
jgi:hypothetical protein